MTEPITQRPDAGSRPAGQPAADRPAVPTPETPGTSLPASNAATPTPTTGPADSAGTGTVAPRRPKIGDTRPAPAPAAPPGAGSPTARPAAPVAGTPATPGTPAASSGSPAPDAPLSAAPPGADPGAPASEPPGAAGTTESATEISTEHTVASSTGRRSGRSRRRGGRDRRAKSVGRYQVCVHVDGSVTQIAVLEGRSLVEHYVSRIADDTTQIDGNVYLGRVQNVLPGMEAAFIDIGIPKNAVLYRGDVRYDRDDVEAGSGNGGQPRIEQVLKPGQLILCQVTKNPIGAKGARLTQEVSLPGRFAVLVPNSSAFGISKRLGDNERRRLRKIVDDVRPEGHGMIVRTAAEGVSAEELGRDVAALAERWRAIDVAATSRQAPGLLYREPELAVRMLREELSSEYRAVLIDDRALFEQVRDYVGSVSPDLMERVEHYDPAVEPLPIFERYHVHEQLRKALDRKVWLPSGGSLIIERTEALTVIDVNTGRNVGSTNLEETVFRNNLEAAEEVARQLRLRDIGGIIVIDFIDMEVKANREQVAAALRTALARDKTRTQVFDISELGLVEMTRKRVSEGLLESASTECETCQGRGVILDPALG